MSGRDAYFAYMRDFNEREGINSFYGRDKKRFLAGWRDEKGERKDKIREDVPEPPRLAPRPPSVPIPESLRVAAEKGREIVENQRMGDEDVNRAAKKPKTPEVSAGRRVYENEDLMRNIQSFVPELPSIPDKKLKALMIKYLSSVNIKTRGKMSIEKELWLEEPPRNLYEQFKEMYEDFKNGEQKDFYPRFKFNKTFNPSEMVKFIENEIENELKEKNKPFVNRFGNFNVGDVVLHNDKPAKITKITNKQMTIRYDEPVVENINDTRSGLERTGYYPQTYKGKNRFFTDLPYSYQLKKIPANYNFKYRGYTDLMA